ncbi:hypothetical protein ABZZ80_45200, partial [Streptomyces sp. NPDC006356]
MGGVEPVWCTPERVLLLSGDPTHVELSVHDARRFEEEEWKTFDHTRLGRQDQPHHFGELPYTWQLDRKGPEKATSWTYNWVMVADGWDHAVTGLELMLAAWVEQYPVQAPGDWIGFNLWTARDWRRDMIVSYSPGQQVRELAVGIHDRGAEQTEERQARMRARPPGRTSYGSRHQRGRRRRPVAHWPGPADPPFPRRALLRQGRRPGGPGLAAYAAT